MSHGEIEKIKAGAPDLNQIDQKIQNEVEAEFPYLTPEARKAIVESRLQIINGPPTGKLIKGDFGDNASKKVKDDLFE
ncbi:MAG: hypothetical protein WA160_06480 [Pseudobdellovibrio sp.]